ncbi:MAG: TonB-dependent receptor [Fibrobacteria bacterium]
MRFQGNLRDTTFPSGARVRLEILETGDTAEVVSGSPFRVDLPRDTLWNLCFSVPGKSDSGAASAGSEAQAAGSETSGRLEKCYEIRYSGTDSAFSADIGQGPAVVVENPAAAGPAAAATAQDSADTSAEASTFKSEDAVQLKKVLVRAQRAPKRSLGKSTVSAKLIKRMPGLAEADVIRSIQALPGVVASSDFSTKIYVRGGGSDQNLILLDKAVVYSPVHFFGLFSTFLVEGINDVNFYKGGFPPEFGNRLSSVLDIKSREGGKDTVETLFKGSSVKISTFASQLHTEGHQGPVRWLVAGRRTYIDEVLGALRDQGLTDLDLNYYFYDLQGNVHYDIDKNKGLMLSWYNGRDLLDFTPFTVEWGNTVIPVNYTQILNRDWSTQATASYSLFSQKFALENIFAFYNRILTATYKQSFEYTGLDAHRLSAGVDLNWMETIFTNDQIIAKITVRDYTEFWLNSVFAQDKWTVGNAEVTSGLRLTHSTKLDEPGIEPRLSLKYKLPHNQSLDFHTGYYKQYVNSIQFSDQESLNEFYYPAKKTKFRTVEPTSSILFSSGYGVDRVRGQWDMSLEGYYKTLNHLVVYAPNDVPDSIALNPETTMGDVLKEAQGYSYGFEASLRRPEGLVFGGVSYSNGTSVIREDGNPQPYFPSWHQPHSAKADLALNILGKDGLWKQGNRKYLRLSTQLKYATGLPYTEYIGYMNGHLLDQNQGRQAGGPNPEFQDNINLLHGNRNAAFVPAYFRWDVKAIDWGRENKWNFSWTILNITDHKNIFFYTYNRGANPPERIEITQFPFFPFLVNYEYYF